MQTCQLMAVNISHTVQKSVSIVQKGFPQYHFLSDDKIL